MNPAILILLPIIFAIFLTGGISIKSPPGSGTSTEPVTLSEGALAGIFNTLQINSLIPGIPVTTVPTLPPGVTETPIPIPTLPPGVSPTKGPSPTHSPTATPSKTPTPTPGPSLCKGKKIAFDLLFDVSGSIGSLSSDMQKASRRLINLLDDEAVVGIQEFSKSPREVLPFNKLKVNRAQAINLVGQGSRDLTYMEDGWNFARGRISAGQSQFPGYKWYLVYFSDGVPNCSKPSDYPNLPPDPCAGDTGDDGPNPEQDPTDVANGMKPTITIWSIGFYQYLSYLGSSNLNNAALLPYGSINDFTRINRYAEALMQRVASPNGYRNVTGNISSLDSLYEQIGRSACP